MSKPIVRVVIAVLICLAVVAAASPTVQSKFGSILRGAEVSNPANASMSTDSQTLEEGTANKQLIPAPSLDNRGPSDSSRDCNSDPTADY